MQKATRSSVIIPHVPALSEAATEISTITNNPQFWWFTNLLIRTETPESVPDSENARPNPEWQVAHPHLTRRGIFSAFQPPPIHNCPGLLGAPRFCRRCDARQQLALGKKSPTNVVKRGCLSGRRPHQSPWEFTISILGQHSIRSPPLRTLRWFCCDWLLCVVTCTTRGTRAPGRIVAAQYCF